MGEHGLEVALSLALSHEPDEQEVAALIEERLRGVGIIEDAHVVAVASSRRPLLPKDWFDLYRGRNV